MHALQKRAKCNVRKIEGKSYNRQIKEEERKSDKKGDKANEIMTKITEIERRNNEAN
jgi:hypothetical protein